MQIDALQLCADALAVRWSDGSLTDYPLLFLRDNDPAGFHPQTEERVLDLLDIPDDLSARGARIEGDRLVIDWAGDRGGQTAIPTAWLHAHRPGRRAPDAADVATVSWGAEFASRIPRVDATDLLADDRRLLAWLTDTSRFGLSVVAGLRDDEEAGVAVAARIGSLRETNFGRTFRVETMPDPNNLAYTAHALALHTDLPNQELPPGFQFLHCVRNGAEGGASIFADAFGIAGRVAERDGEAFRLLSTIPVPYRFHDRNVDIRVHRPLIGLDERDRVHDVRFSAHLMDAFDMPAEIMPGYYRALRLFMAETRDPAAIVAFRMRPGEMVVFDNRRVLHGRTAFDPSTGHRLLKGFYVDRGEWNSRIRMLAARKRSASQGGGAMMDRGPT